MGARTGIKLRDLSAALKTSGDLTMVKRDIEFPLGIRGLKEQKLSHKGMKALSRNHETLIAVAPEENSERIGLVTSTIRQPNTSVSLGSRKIAACGESYATVVSRLKPTIKQNRGDQIICVDKTGQILVVLFVKETVVGFVLVAPSAIRL